MRVRIIFSLKNKGGIVPFHHQHILARLIEEIHPVAEYAKRKDSKIFYNFSGLKGQTRVGKYGLHFYSSKVTLVFAASDKEYLDDFLKKIFDFRELGIGQLRLAPESVLVEELPNFAPTEEGNKFISISPLVVIHPLNKEISAKDFIPPETDAFSDFLYDSTMSRMEKSGKYSPEEIASFFRFQVEPDPTYMTKVRREEKKFARIYTVYFNREKHEVRGYTMPFALFAVRPVLEFVFNFGLGELTNKGFGMIDAVQEEFSERVKPYDFGLNPDKSENDLDELYSFSVVPKEGRARRKRIDADEDSSSGKSED